MNFARNRAALRGKPRVNQEMLTGYTRYINAKDGVITWDVPPTGKGLIPPDCLELLTGLGKPPGSELIGLP